MASVFPSLRPTGGQGEFTSPARARQWGGWRGTMEPPIGATADRRFRQCLSICIMPPWFSIIMLPPPPAAAPGAGAPNARTGNATLTVPAFSN